MNQFKFLRSESSQPGRGSEAFTRTSIVPHGATMGPGWAQCGAPESKMASDWGAGGQRKPGCE